MPTQKNVGLFGCISGVGLVVDLEIDGYIIGKSNVGSVVGYIRHSKKTGGFMISNCVSYAVVTSTDGNSFSAGGIVGVAMGGKNNAIFLDRCISYGSVNNKDIYYEDIGTLEVLIGAVSRQLVVRYRSVHR